MATYCPGPLYLCFEILPLNCLSSHLRSLGQCLYCRLILVIVYFKRNFLSLTDLGKVAENFLSSITLCFNSYCLLRKDAQTSPLVPSGFAQILPQIWFPESAQAVALLLQRALVPQIIIFFFLFFNSLSLTAAF